MNRVSVVVPVYRCLPHVEGCLRSVLAQTRPAHEIVLVDDRGGDESMAVAQRYLTARGANFRSVVHDENRGLGRARNSGLAASTGDLVWFLDSDDEADPRFLELLTDALESGSADFACTRTRRVDEAGRVLQIDEPPFGALVISGEDFARHLVLGSAKAYACTKLFRRELLGERPWDEGQGYEDMAPALRMALASERVALVDEPLYRYLYREGSISTSLGPRTFDLFKVERDVRATVAGAGLADRWQRALLGFRYREIFRSVAHVAMRADHASPSRPDLYDDAIRRVRAAVSVRDVTPLLRTGHLREAVFAVLLKFAPALYSTILRYR
ncbi:glycosyltransferase family 2 protein [Rhodococcus sp. NPDC003318]|uniref:glycosyltransferase family 2 protein n=1 Tax=Rhodococcus sp. NPDC003318 TaxID=3364503 RepID=UPI0036D1AB4B